MNTIQKDQKEKLLVIAAIKKDLEINSIDIEAKKKKAKSPKQHGYFQECVRKNKDKKNPEGYCASIIDKVKGTTKWRTGPKGKK